MRKLKYKFERTAILLLVAIILGGGFCIAAVENGTSAQEPAGDATPVIVLPTLKADKPLSAVEVSAEPTPAATPEPSRYTDIDLTEEDVETLARLVWLEARGEPFEGQVAVVEVVFNRILSDRFPGQDGVQTVVFAKGQFSPSPYIWSDSTTPTEQQYEAVWTAYAALEPTTDLDVVYFSTEPQNEREFRKIGNHYFCRV